MVEKGNGMDQDRNTDKDMGMGMSKDEDSRTSTIPSSVTVALPKLIVRTDDVPYQIVPEVPRELLEMEPTRAMARGIALHGDKMLCVRQDLTGIWAIPGGGIEEGETPKQAVAREMLEETGFVVTRATYAVGVREVYGGRLYVTHIFLCEGEKTDDSHRTDGERMAGQQAIWQPIEAAIEEFAKGLPDEAPTWYDEDGGLRPDLLFMAKSLPHVPGIYAREEAILRTLFPCG